ncbi:MAG: energy-coupling factor transporter transmembrane protein EcfT [Firmicutes bacterium]|nr:energy-coupling factor transporter transmembrane protein EcfT [Bacillota bacterium]
MPGSTPVHRLDPFTKVVYAVSVVAAGYVLPDLRAVAVLLGLNLALLAVARVLRRTWPVFAMTLFILSTVFLIQGLYFPGNRTVLVRLGPAAFYREGLAFALDITVRLYNLLAGTVALILTTRPSDLIESLVRRGLSPRIGYVMTSVLQLIPSMSAAAAAIVDAQRARGLETEGSLRARLRAYLPVIGPLVSSSLIAVQERAMALEVRAFGARGPRTFLSEEVVPPHGPPVRALAVTLLVGSVVWRLVA